MQNTWVCLRIPCREESVMSESNDTIKTDLMEQFPEFICEECGTVSTVVMRVREPIIETENGYITKKVGLCITCFFEKAEEVDESDI